MRIVLREGMVWRAAGMSSQLTRAQPSGAGRPRWWSRLSTPIAIVSFWTNRAVRSGARSSRRAAASWPPSTCQSPSSTRFVVEGDAGLVERLFVAAQAAVHDPSTARADDRADPPVAVRDEVAGGEQAGLDVIGADQGHPGARHGMDADDGHVRPEDLAHAGLALQLGGRQQDPLDAPLDQGAQVAFAIAALAAIGPDDADDDAVALPAGLALGPDDELRQHVVREVAGDDADGPRGAGDETPRDGVGHVAEVSGGVEDPLASLAGDAPLAVEDFARRLEADASPGRHRLDRDRRHRRFPSESERSPSRVREAISFADARQRFSHRLVGSTGTIRRGLLLLGA